VNKANAALAAAFAFSGPRIARIGVGGLCCIQHPQLFNT